MFRSRTSPKSVFQLSPAKGSQYFFVITTKDGLRFGFRTGSKGLSLYTDFFWDKPQVRVFNSQEFNMRLHPPDFRGRYVVSLITGYPALVTDPWSSKWVDNAQMWEFLRSKNADGYEGSRLGTFGLRLKLGPGYPRTFKDIKTPKHLDRFIFDTYDEWSDYVDEGVLYEI